MITTSDQLTPEYLTSLLRTGGFLEHGKVINIENKLTKRLVVSVVSRLEISYSADVSGLAPSQLFLKVSIPALSSSSDHYTKEVEFYNVVAREMNDRSFVRCYAAAYSPESANYFLLLDDLSDTHSQPDSPLPPSQLHSELAVESLAQLHAFWWGHPQLGKKIGSLFDDSTLNAFVGEVEKNVISFVDFLGDGLSSTRRKIYERLLASKRKVWGRLTDATGLTVTHGDAHWWNFLYPLDTNKHQVCLVDWQLWHVDVGARDLAFMIALGGFSKRRPEMEKVLTRRYYESLVANGVRNYSWDDFWNDYRWAAIRNLNIPVIQWSQGRSTELWQSNLERAMQAYADLGCSDLLVD